MKANEICASASTLATRYAVMCFAEAGAAAALLFGKVARYVSDDRLILLTILFNAIAIGGRGLFALVADGVRHRHTGVLLGTMIFSLGFFWPIDFGIDLKVILAAVGSAAFHAFASASVLAKSSFRSSGIGYLAAGAALGTAFGQYASFFGYLCIMLFMVLAAPSDKSVILPEAEENREKKAPANDPAPLFVLFLLIGIAALTWMFASLRLPDTFEINRKTLVLLAVILAAGRWIGGIASDLFGSLPVLVLSLGGGTALALRFADGKLWAFGCLMLLSLAAAPLLNLVFRFMPCHPGFSTALATGCAYIGYTVAKLYPASKLSVSFLEGLATGGSLLLVGGVLLLVITCAELFLIFRGRRAVKKAGGDSL